MSLSYLLAQKIIVILGGDWADAMHNQSDILGNPGPIYRTYPRRAKMGDADCYPLLKALPKTLDAIFFVGGKRELTIEVLATMCKIGARSVICLADGFDDQS